MKNFQKFVLHHVMTLDLIFHTEILLKSELTSESFNKT